MQTMICNAAKAVARALGCGHSERVYQKALSIELQKRAAGMLIPTTHSLEYHVPVLYDNMAVGSERIDIVLRDADERTYIVELKATEGSLRRGRTGSSPEMGDALPAPHVQLLKYLRMMWTRDHVAEGYVINFRQRVLYDAAPLLAPCELEVDRFDVTTQQWHFDVADRMDTAPVTVNGAGSGASGAGGSVGAYVERVGGGQRARHAEICVDTGISIGI